MAILGVCVLVALGIIALAGDDGGGTANLPAPPPTSIPTATAPVPRATPLPASPTPSAIVDGIVVPDGRNVVCLDPGHGGSDRGKVRVENDQIVLQEKDLTLEHALRLGERLEARGIGVAFTRTIDTEVNPNNLDFNGDGEVASPDGEARSDEGDDLIARTVACNEAAADLLVSIHYNSSENEFLEGYEVWYNDQRPFSDRSLRFARLIHAELGERMAEAGYPALDHGLGVENHAVTGPLRKRRPVASAMPGAVVEGLFLSSAEDAAFVVTDAATEAIVTAYEQAIVGYFSEYPG